MTNLYYKDIMANREKDSIKKQWSQLRSKQHKQLRLQKTKK